MVFRLFSYFHPLLCRILSPSAPFPPVTLFCALLLPADDVATAASAPGATLFLVPLCGQGDLPHAAVVAVEARVPVQAGAAAGAGRAAAAHAGRHAVEAAAQATFVVVKGVGDLKVLHRGSILVKTRAGCEKAIYIEKTKNNKTTSPHFLAVQSSPSPSTSRLRQSGTRKSCNP